MGLLWKPKCVWYQALVKLILEVNDEKKSYIPLDYKCQPTTSGDPLIIIDTFFTQLISRSILLLINPIWTI